MGGNSRFTGCTIILPVSICFIHKELKKMRIVAGEFRSRVISAVEGNNTRPTTDKIKEAIFSFPYRSLFRWRGNARSVWRQRQYVFGGDIPRYGVCAICDVSYPAISTIRKNVRTLDVASRVTI